jgi:hypothetical protein
MLQAMGKVFLYHVCRAHPTQCTLDAPRMQQRGTQGIPSCQSQLVYHLACIVSTATFAAATNPAAPLIMPVAATCRALPPAPAKGGRCEPCSWQLHVVSTPPHLWYCPCLSCPCHETLLQQQLLQQQERDLKSLPWQAMEAIEGGPLGATPNKWS